MAKAKDTTEETITETAPVVIDETPAVVAEQTVNDPPAHPLSELPGLLRKVVCAGGTNAPTGDGFLKLADAIELATKGL